MGGARRRRIAGWDAFRTGSSRSRDPTPQRHSPEARSLPFNANDFWPLFEYLPGDAKVFSRVPETFRGLGDPFESEAHASSVLEVLLRQTLRWRRQQLSEIEIGLSQSIRLADLNVVSDK